MPLSGRLALFGVLGLAALQFAWNAAFQPAFWGYDEGAHAAFALAIRELGALPHPLSGWSSFHPPLYHLLGAGAWAALEPFGGGTVLFALRAISGLAVLGMGAVIHRLAWQATGDAAIAFTACTVALFLPVSQLSASMAGNEALAAGLAATALIPLVALQRDPHDLRSAALAGLCAGLALATKYTGAWTVAICAVPFLRLDLDRAGVRAALVCASVVLVVAGPVYLRNLAVTGTPLPLTRTLEPMKRYEERMLVRPRQVSDYLSLPWRCGQYPYVTIVTQERLVAGANAAMHSLPCLTYVGLWFDPFGIRATRTGPYDGVVWGTLLVSFGLCPTLAVLVGLSRSTRRAFSTRGRATETPLVALTALGVLSYAGFTWLAPSFAAAKASYLLPLVAPAGVFFAHGCAWLPTGVRRGVLAASVAAAAFAAFVFTTGTVFPSADPLASKGYWVTIGQELPDSYIVEAALRLIE